MIIKIMTPRPNLAPSQGLSVFHKKILKIVCETVRPSPLIFGMLHKLMVLYQD